MIDNSTTPSIYEYNHHNNQSIPLIVQSSSIQFPSQICEKGNIHIIQENEKYSQ
jgi:hypothetical protein